MRAMTRIVRDDDNGNRDYPQRPTGSGNRPGAKIFQLRNLPQKCGPLLFQIGK